ncbi:MAG: hypothetical protein Q8P22_01850 [Chloroflexota bacterium]|nr:hypothetical protein [Chloroflexota bacterium]
MAAKGEKLPLMWRIHNVICPAWFLRVGFLRAICPACRRMTRRLQAKQQ